MPLPAPVHLEKMLPSILLLAGLLWLPSDAASQTEGDYLYNVTMVRAAPGQYAEFIEAVEQSTELHQEASDPLPFWIRHSQGDQWDFMLIVPMDDFDVYYGEDRIRRRTAVWNSPRGREARLRLAAVTAFREEWFARSIPLEAMAGRFEGMGLFHVEMFAGLPGKRAELLEQRRMENRYYEHLDRQLNVIFTRDSGPNWDAMTIGFYRDLQAYAAAGARYSAEEQGAAARAAGFEDVSRIGPYLRSLLSYHHDTLAVPAR